MPKLIYLVVFTTIFLVFSKNYVRIIIYPIFSVSCDHSFKMLFFISIFILNIGNKLRVIKLDYHSNQNNQSVCGLFIVMRDQSTFPSPKFDIPQLPSPSNHHTHTPLFRPFQNLTYTTMIGYIWKIFQ